MPLKIVTDVNLVTEFARESHIEQQKFWKPENTHNTFFLLEP